MRNFIVSPTGGVRKRPGLRFLDYALDVTIGGIRYPSYLVKFEFSLGQTYALEFGDYTMRFWLDDHLIINPLTNTPYQIDTPYSYTQIKEATFAQYKDTMFFTHWDLPIQKLTRGRSDSHTNWYWDLVIVEPEDLVRAPGGVRLTSNGHNGVSYAVTAVKNGQESRGGYGAVAAYDPGRQNPTTAPTTSTDPYQLFANVDAWINRWRPQFGSVAGFPSIPTSVRDKYENGAGAPIPVPSEWDNVYQEYIIEGGAWGVLIYATEKVVRALDTLGYVLEGGSYSITEGGTIDPSSVTLQLGAPSRFIRSSAYGVMPPYDYTEYFWQLRRKRDGFVTIVPLFHVKTINQARLDTSLEVDVAAMRAAGIRYSIHSGAPSSTNSNITISGRTTFSGVGFTSKHLGIMLRDGDFGSMLSMSDIRPIYDQCMKFIDDGTIRVNNIVAWNASTGATAYNIYRNIHADENYTGFYLMAQVPSNKLTWEDTNVSETTANLSYSPKESGQYFNSPDTYPHVCSFFQQRLIVGSTKFSPLMLGGSTPGFFEDFLESENPMDTTGAWRFELTSATSNPIMHIIPIQGLYILTQAGAFASTQQGSINRSNVNFNQQAYNGSSSVKPVLVDRSALYVPLNKQMVCSLTYDYTANAFVDDNMLFAAQDLLNNTSIESAAYARPISSIVCVTLADGRALACTYIPRQEFLGWAEIITQGSFKQVCQITNERGYDEFYFVVERNGQFFIEKMEDTRPFNRTQDIFSDSCLTGTFTDPVTTVTGLEHLEGREVVILADGEVVDPQMVVDGKVQLTYPATEVQVGLAYIAELETLDLELQGLPTMRGLMRHITRAIVEVEHTSDFDWRLNGGEWWPAELLRIDQLQEMPAPVTKDISIGGSCDYVNGTRLSFKSEAPLPCSINSVVLEVQYG